METKLKSNIDINRDLYDSADDHKAKFVAEPGLNEEIVRVISKTKSEPEWMLEKRLKGLKLFQETSMPNWSPDLSKLNFDEIVYFVDPNTEESTSWKDVPKEIKNTFEKLGIPEAEKKALAGVGAQYDSSVIYHNVKKALKDQGVIFENMDVAVQKYPELIKKHFMTSCIPIHDHKLIMLHAAVWSGGTFIYIPPGVKVELPLQAYFRMNQQSGGQFEHTLIIVDKGAELHYIEGCSSPRYTKNSLHAGCVEIFVKEGAKMRYSSIENWSKNVYNLNTKRAFVDKKGTMVWVSGNMGCLTEDSKVFTNPKGPVKIKEIEEGDRVYVWDEKTNGIKKSIVTRKINSGIKDVYRVEAGGRVIEASANHPFLTLTRRKNQPWHKKGFFHHEWKALEKLKEGDVIGIAKKLPIVGEPHKLPRLPINRIVKSKNQYKEFEMNLKNHYRKDISVPTETDEDFMWFMGIMLGDGFIDVKNHKINLAIHETDSLRPIVIDIVEKLFNYTITTKKERFMEIYSKGLGQFFIDIGFGGTAATKKVPKWVFKLPRNQILAFLAGYLDSDGHPAKAALAFTSINKKILESVKLLAISCGFCVSRIFSHRKAKEVIILGNKCNAKDSWRIHLNGKNIQEIPIRSPNKQKRAIKINSQRDYGSAGGLNLRSKTNKEIGFATIQKIISIGKKPTYDIEVKDYHNFIAEGIIVHNSSTTMLYPCSILRGEGAKTDNISIAFAGKDQVQDIGAKAIHIAPNTSSTINSKSISRDGGISTYRGLVRILPSAKDSKTSVVCDALILDEISKSETIPALKIENNEVDAVHEAKVGKISEEAIFYLQSRGVSEEDAIKMIVSGFIQPIIKELPLEYALELNRLIEIEMEGTA